MLVPGTAALLGTLHIHPAGGEGAVQLLEPNIDEGSVDELGRRFDAADHFPLASDREGLAHAELLLELHSEAVAEEGCRGG